MLELFRQTMNFFRYLGLIFANKSGYKDIVKRQLFWDYLKLVAIKNISTPFRINFSTIKFLNHRLFFSDIKTTISLIESIFIENEYFFKSKSRKPFIVDLGSNIGLSIIYFKTLYPQSTILSFEADPTTYKTLELNISSFGFDKITPYNLAVSKRQGKIPFYVAKKGYGSPLMSTNPQRIVDKQKIYVESVRLSSFVKSNIDFLKMDIEGSEHEVLIDLNNKKKLKLFNQICIEYHHHLDKSEDELSGFLKILENNQFGYQIHASQNTPFTLRIFEDIQIHAYKR